MAQDSNKKMGITMAVVALVVVVLGFVFIGGSDAPNVSQANAAQTQKTTKPEPPAAPDFTLQSLNGDELTLSSYKGQLVFVNFWATWCGPCRQEIPSFIDLMDKYKKDGFTVLGIALDPREFDKVPGFVDQIGINYPILFDKTGEVSQMYGGIRSIPTTFVVNREGKVIQQIVGSRPHNVFEKLITDNL